MKVVAAVLKYVGPPSEAPDQFEVSYGLPNGKTERIKWSKPSLTARVPVLVTYRDDFGQVKTFHENYAKFLLSAYGPQSKFKYLEFVSEVKEAEVADSPFADVQPTPAPEPVAEPSVEEPVAEVKPVKKPKGKKDEDAS